MGFSGLLFADRFLSKIKFVNTKCSMLNRLVLAPEFFEFNQEISYQRL